MLYLLLGIISGIILSLAPIWSPTGAIEIYPEWHGGIDSIRHIQESPNPLISKIQLQLKTSSDIYLLSGKGKLLKQINLNDHMASAGKSGSYYAQYDKTGNYVELRNIMGDRFWRIKSMEYPHIASSGKIILLMNGDRSRVRIIDLNGNPAGAKEIHGGLCTAIAAEGSDYSGLGFLDGSYYVLNDKGEILNKGTAPEGSIVKWIAISTNGKFFVIHYGSNKKDFLRLVDSDRGKSYTIQLRHVHLTRTAVIVTDKGDIKAIDYNRIIIGRYDEIERIIKIPPGSAGASSIDSAGDLYSAAYSGIDGNVNFFIFLEDGAILFHKVFPGENFVESGIYEKAVFIRGSANLYCYSFQIPDDK